MFDIQSTVGSEQIILKTLYHGILFCMKFYFNLTESFDLTIIHTHRRETDSLKEYWAKKSSICLEIASLFDTGCYVPYLIDFFFKYHLNNLLFIILKNNGHYRPINIAIQ